MAESTVSEEEFSWSLAQALKDFSVESLKAEQVECIRRLICLREDVLAVLPTGFGKSLIYQIIPNVCSCLVLKKSKETKSFVVCVVSPLEYIRKQQVESIKKLDCGLRTAAIGERDEMDKDIEEGRVNIIFGSAEQWLSDESLTVWQGIGRKGKAAFREAFGRVLELRSLMKNVTPVLGLTATANKDMRDHLIKYLGMKSNLKPIVVSPNKDNIRFTVLKADKSMHCFDWLVDVLKEKKENTPFTIIFCKTVNDIVSVLTFFLMKLGQSGLYIDGECPKHERCLLGVYYSQTPQKHKDSVNSSFEGLSGNVRVVCASTSLSMGVDFKHVQYVVHYGPSKNLISHLQEAGRAGRDGREAFHTSLSRETPCYVCCNVCHKNCKCAGSDCSIPIPIFDCERAPSTVDLEKSRTVSEDERLCLKDALYEVQSSLSSESKVRMFDSTGVVGHGLSNAVIEAVVSNAQNIFNVYDVIDHCNAPSLKTAVIMLEIVNELFCNVDIPDELYSLVSHQEHLYLVNHFTSSLPNDIPAYETGEDLGLDDLELDDTLVD
ncbi:putative ATP-dependent DNA helicase Q1 [Montipora foliosa]|uniref:putative ATP-dependent DNA helicase Q1 n=1 Tax=Montipora foliosa TaxID=591990 RepID=UPI0035F14A04